MEISLTNPIWADAEHTKIDVTIDTETVRINAIPGLRHYDNLLASGVKIAPYVAPDPAYAWDLVMLKIAFNHENRIRALESKAPITLLHFKNAVKALL